MPSSPPFSKAMPALGVLSGGLFFLLLVWGNLVAGLKAGLACPDWPLCHGSLIPPLRWDIYMEFGHRVLGALASISLILLSLIRYRSYKGGFKSIPLIALGLIVVQVILGGLVVLFELPTSLASIHFGIALVVYGLILYMGYFETSGRVLGQGSAQKNSWPLLALALMVLVQSELGAIVRHTGAGLACPDIPTCQGSLWIPRFLSPEVLLHLSHRALGVFTALFGLSLPFLVKKDRMSPAKRLRIDILAGLAVIQVLLGVSVVLSKLEAGMAALHMGVALALFTFSLLGWFESIQKESLP